MFLTSNTVDISKYFSKWCSDSTKKDNCCVSLNQYQIIEKILIKERIINRSIFKYTDFKVIHKICNNLITDRIFHFRYKKASDYVRALRRYERFLHEFDINSLKIINNTFEDDYSINTEKNDANNILENYDNKNELIEKNENESSLQSELTEIIEVDSIITDTENKDLSSVEKPDLGIETEKQSFIDQDNIESGIPIMYDDVTKESIDGSKSLTDTVEPIEIEVNTESKNEEKIEIFNSDDITDSISESDNKEVTFKHRKRREKKDLIHTEKSKSTNDFVPSEKLREYDNKKYKSTEWDKNIFENSFSNSSLMAVITQQMKVLKKMYGNYPLGLVKISNDQYKELKNNCREWVKYDISQISDFKAVIISFYMIQFVIKEHNTEEFWTKFFSSLKIQDTINNRNNFSNALKKLCVNEELYFCYSNGRSMVVDTLKTHAIVNKSSIAKVMEGIFDYYSEIMNETYNDDTALFFIKNFIQLMQTSCSKDGQGKGRYIASHSFKCACVNFESALTDCVLNTIYNMNSDLYNLDKYRETPAAFIYHYRIWKNFLKYSNKKSNLASKSISIAPIRKYSKPTFILDDKLNLILEIPQFEIPEDVSVEDEDFILRFYDGNKELYGMRRNLNVFGRFKFKTDSVEIKIPELYKNFRFSIVSNGYIIYDSSDLLNKKYMVFNTGFEEYISSKLPKEEFFLVVSCEDATVIDCYNELKRDDRIRIYAVDAEENSEIYVNSEPVFRIKGDENIGIHFEIGRELKNVRIIKSGIMYYVWEQLPNLIISSNNSSNISDYSISLNGRTISITYFYKNKKAVIDINKWCDESSSVCIFITRGKEKIIWEYNIIKLSNFIVEYGEGKEYFYKEHNFIIDNIYADELDFSAISFPVVQSIGTEKNVLLDAEMNKEKVKVQLKLPIISWSLNESFNSEQDNIYVTESEFAKSSILKLNIPFENYYITAAGKNKIYTLQQKNNKVDLSSFISHSDEYTDIGIVFKGAQIKFFEIIHKPCIRDLFIRLQNKGKQIQLQYKLFGECSLIVTAYSNDNSFYQEIFRSDNSYDGIIDSGIPEGIYSLKVELEEEDEFGFDTNRKELKTMEIVVGDFFGVYCDTLRKQKKDLRITKCIIDNQEKPISDFCIGKVKSRVEGYMYLGVAYRCKFDSETNEYKRKVFKEANPVFIRIISIEDGVLTVSVTDKDDDGFLYDKIRKTIIPDTKGIKNYRFFDAPDLFYIDTKGEEI